MGGAAPRWSVVAAGCAAAAGDAKQARCSTTDDGAYDCQFRRTGASGSFEISAPGKPTYSLDISEAGIAFGFVKIDGAPTPLPGRYLRSQVDRACWRNDATETEICAW